MTNDHSSKWLALCAVILVSVFLAGCLAFPPSPAETPFPIISTCPPSPISLSTPESLTSIPSPSSAPATRTPILTRTPLPPTLTADEKRAYVRQMLETNGGCELPCWWGVMPGESDWQDVVDYFAAHGGFQFIVLSAEGLYAYEVLHTFTEKSSVVQSIEVTGHLSEDIPAQFVQDWTRYSLDQVLTRYGVPSQLRITLALPVEPNGPIYYNLYVLYDDLGIGIRYSGPALVQGELLYTCFSFEDITLWLQSPESPIPLDRAINKDEWSFAVPVEEATGMSVEEFYEVFRHPGACLEAPPTFGTLLLTDGE